MTNVQRILNYHIYKESSNGLDYISSNYISNYMEDELYFFDDLYNLAIRYTIYE